VYTLYVIPGSHACRAAMLMLKHKGVPYRRVDFVTLTHPVASRLVGFDAGGQTRSAGGRRTFGLRFGDRLGTVPGLAANGDRISTNHGIARFLDERHPEPRLFPEDRGQRKAVEEAEAWANDTLQMEARRILVAAAMRDPAGMSEATADGRMGYLLYKQPALRRLIFPRVLGGVFAASPDPSRDPVAELPAMLDRVDGWIGEGVLNGGRLNAADFMIAPCLALILYRPDTEPEFEGRPSLKLVDRILPAPGPAPSVADSPGPYFSGR
jgi:glutathione S-transferase